MFGKNQVARSKYARNRVEVGKLRIKWLSKHVIARFSKAQSPSPLQWCFCGIRKGSGNRTLKRMKIKKGGERWWAFNNPDTLSLSHFSHAKSRGICLPSYKAQDTPQEEEKRKNEEEDRALWNLLQNLHWSQTFLIPTQNE